MSSLKKSILNPNRIIWNREILYTCLFLLLSTTYIAVLTHFMGLSNFFSTIMNTAYGLLIDTAFYIMAISVVMGSVAALLSEFNIVLILNKIFSPLMKPLYNLPGAAFLGIITTYLSDNPSIIVLANDKKFKNYFLPKQIPCLCNLGTAFGMGLVLTTFMIGQGFILEPLIGTLGAIIGSVVSVRTMNFFINKSRYFEIDPPKGKNSDSSPPKPDLCFHSTKNDHESFFTRFMTAMLEGGKNGVEMGGKIIPGLLFVCTIIMTLTFGASNPDIGYTGAAYEGVAILPRIGDKLSFIIKPLFGFTSSECIAFPITSMGAVGAALSLVPRFIQMNIISGNDIAVFTSMGMCWSGYLSTHVSMMDALNHRKLIPTSIFSHTIGGLIAGISAHFLYLLLI